MSETEINPRLGDVLDTQAKTDLELGQQQASSQTELNVNLDECAKSIESSNENYARISSNLDACQRDILAMDRVIETERKVAESGFDVTPESGKLQTP